MNSIHRIVVCEAPLSHTVRSPRVEWAARAAQLLGDQLGLPTIATKEPLEHCEPTDFVLYDGLWSEFVDATPTWSAEDHRLRAHRLGHLRADRGNDYGDFLDGVRFAFASAGYPGGPPVNAGPRSEIIAIATAAQAAGLKVFRTYQTQNYVAALSPPGMPLEQLMATYLRTYWEMYGY